MNEQLKFSWGHIVAFVALIIISYITFVGTTYKTDGDFVRASIYMVVIDIVLVVIFMGAQMMKATSKKFAKRIWIERCFIFSSPIVFLFGLLPFYHFGTVQSQDKEIVDCFTNAIKSSKQMFDDYDKYSNDRIKNYEQMLSRIVSNEKLHPDLYLQCGFTRENGEIEKKNMVKTLQLQLISANYDSLKHVANDWIESSSNGASTFNVFLLGNTKKIKSAIHEWHKILVDFSTKELSNEEFNGYNQVVPFSEVSGSLASVDAGLNGLTEKFTCSAFPPIESILCSIVLYFALLFPYFLQDRHTKSQVRLLGMEKGASRSSSMTIDTSNKCPEVKIEPYEEDEEPVSSKPCSNDEYDEYKSFTI